MKDIMMKYKKICKCCGKLFETNSPQKLFCDRDHYLPCPICGKCVYMDTNIKNEMIITSI